ncbi:CBS domain-containing protein [Streptomyces sp. NPDC002566]|uniref:CBS domain-containing protein n=1 Tax=Streptomyces sp. NPDC002566 TaxID=3364650 RepID=UPI0036BD6F20
MKTRSVGEVMTREVVQARRQTTFKELVRLLNRHRIGGLPVVDADDKVVGVISATDLVRGQAERADRADRAVPRVRLPGLRRPVRVLEGGAPGLVAAELMSSPAVTVHPEQLVPEAARMMERHHIERLPVVDEEDRLIGIATRRDLLRVFLRTDEEIRRQVTDEVVAGALGLSCEAVTVFVRDGVVTLKGRLERRSDIPPAIRSAWRVEGAVGVVNGLTFDVDDCRRAEPHPVGRPVHGPLA